MDADRFAFELERQDKFAEILGLPNTAYAYEYLRAGETDGVRGWKKFVHVPNLAPEKAAKRAARAKLKTDFKQLQSEGMLLVDELGEKGKVKGRFDYPLWTANPSTPEVLMMWKDSAMVNPEAGEWRRLSGPNWQEGSCDCPAATDAREVKISPSGRLLAEISRLGDRVNVWDLRERKILRTKTFPRMAKGLTFSPDENWIYTVAPPIELHRISLRSGIEDCVLGGDYVSFEHVAVHPDGLMAAVVDNFGVLIAVDLTQMRIINEVWIKETKSLLSENQREELIARASQSIVAELKQHLPQSEVDEHIKRSARHHLPKDAIRLCGFSPDGRFLFCGTHEGVRVLDFNEVLRCSRMQPVRVQSGADADELPGDDASYSVGHKLVYCIVYDALANRIIFSGVEGKIKFLDLETQNAGDLITIPGRLAISHLDLTADRSAFVTTAMRVQFKGADPTPTRFQLWNYRALCERNNLRW